MAERSENRFLNPQGEPRVAACIDLFHPNPDCGRHYEAVHRLWTDPDLDIRYVQARCRDPREVPLSWRGLVDRGFLVPASDEPLAADRSHFEATRSADVARLEAEAREVLGEFADESLSARAWSVGFGLARSMQAWAPDVVVSTAVGDPGMFGYVISQLLGLPWVVLLRGGLPPHPANRWQAVGKLVARCADVIVAEDAEITGRLRQRFGDSRGERVVLLEGDGSVASAACTALLDRPRRADATPLGPVAAFRTDPTPEPDPGGALPFVVLGAERTGSNMLVGMIGSRTDVVIGGELFNMRMRKAGELPWPTRDAAHADSLRELRERDPRAFLREVADQANQQGARAWGFKLLYYHGTYDDRIVDHLLAMPRLRVVHLRRRDRLRRWLSHRRAEITDTWYSGKKDRSQASVPQAVELGVSDTLRDFLLNEVMEERYAALFAGHEVLELSYEDFSEDIDGTAARLAEFLDIPLAELQVKSRRQSRGGLRESIADLDVIVEALRGTRWEGLLDEVLSDR